ncbi:MAG: hypothetical protein HDT18_05035 [Oscillibacter sp.]|nr:hypothetical protein [Oscillibacter sp.]
MVYWDQFQRGCRNMIPVYYVLRVDRASRFVANIRPAVQRDFLKTEQENWQTSWLTDFIQDEALENTQWKSPEQES